MKIWGKLVGALLGWVLFRHPIGAALGFALGHAWDEGWLRLSPPAMSGGEVIESLFALAGSVAKANGRVSEAEIGATERLMQRMGLDATQRGIAIASFNRGKQDTFDLDAAAVALHAWNARRGDQRLIALEVLAEIGAADGMLASAAEARLARIARILQVPQGALDWVLRRYRGGTRPPPPRSSMPAVDPYTVLGVQATATDSEVRRAYRRLIAKHHPDKLQSRGASPEMIRVAEERAREINAAYEQLRSLRGFT